MLFWLKPAKRAAAVETSKSKSKSRHHGRHSATESRDDCMNVDVDTQLHCDSSITVLQQQFLAVRTTTSYTAVTTGRSSERISPPSELLQNSNLHLNLGDHVTLATLPFEKNLRGHVWTVPENTCVKFEVRSFNRFGAIGI